MGTMAPSFTLNLPLVHALRTPERNDQRLRVSKVKALLSGVGIAAMAGLLMGAAMKPDLRGDERPEGPQIFAGWSGVRSTGPFDPGMSFADYSGQLPDYVVGTDWRAAMAFRENVAYDPAPTPDYYERERRTGGDYAYQAPTPYVEPPREEPVYPSMGGGTAYNASDRVRESRPAPPPRSEPVDLDEEAPPEATGDTSPATS